MQIYNQKYKTSNQNREFDVFANFFHNFVEGNKIKIGFTLQKPTAL